MIRRHVWSAAAAGLGLVLVSACGSQPAAPPPAPAAPPSPSSAPPSSVAPPVNNEVRVGISAFSWFDNDPPGVSPTDHPVLHQTDGGQGTFADPITASVSGDEGHLSFPAGTKLYLPSLQRYIIVEDAGQPPGPPGTVAALSIWIDGQGGAPADVNNCEDAVTGSGKVVADVNPAPDEKVIPGPIYANHVCNIPAPQ